MTLTLTLATHNLIFISNKSKLVVVQSNPFIGIDLYREKKTLSQFQAVGQDL